METTMTAAPVAAPASPATPAVAKTRLFWRKSCDSLKDSTSTEIKEGEVFVLTGHTVQVENPDEALRAKQPLVTMHVYSLKRGKRIYYTPYVTPEQAQVANDNAKALAEKKEAEAQAKAEEKAKKEADKAAAKAATPAPAVKEVPMA